jgi:hypothetical protein
MPTTVDRKRRLGLASAHMDDGMGINRDDYDESVVGRFAHFADGSHGRNVYTTDSEDPDPAYANWKHIGTIDLDADPADWFGGE